MSAPSNLAARGLFNSTIGAKIVMALTGFVLVGFVVQHMVANLQLYAGPDALNSYAAGLKGLGGGSVVWLGRAFLLACLGLRHQAGQPGQQAQVHRHRRRHRPRRRRRPPPRWPSWATT
jgi:hypothetical protein